MRKSKYQKRLDATAQFLLRALIAAVVISITAATILMFIHKPEKKKTDIAAAYSIHGIDISHHQGVINWNSVKKATLHGKPILFVFAKCTEGKTRIDKLYERNQKEIRKQGFLFGAYHFFLPHRDAQEQADNFIRHAQLRTGDLPPVLDIEKCGNLTPKQLTEAALIWLEAVEEHYHCIPIIYAGHSFQQQYLTDKRLEKYPLWKAHYQNDGIITGKDWTFCQYTRHGHVAGIGKSSVDVDLNVFCGTKEDIQSMLLD